MRLAVALPEPFQVVPAVTAHDFVRWVDQLGRPRTQASTVGSPTIDRDVAALVEAMASSSDYNRTWLVATPAEPMQHGIPALGWIAANGAGGLTANEVRACANDPRWSDRGDSIGGSVTVHSVAEGTVLLVHQFQPFAARLADEAAVLAERCSALLLDVDKDAVVRLELIALDLLMFADIVVTALSILDSIAVVRERA